MMEALRRLGPSLSWTALAALYLSSEMLFQPAVWRRWAVADILAAWLSDLVELGGLALLLWAVYVGVDALVLVRRLGGGWRRLLLMTLALYGAALAHTLALMLWRSGLAVEPDFGFAAAMAGRWSIVAIYLVLVQSLWRRGHDTDAEARAATLAAAALERESRQMRLQLLKAQIEPHFLFNTLANVRRLYRAEPGRAAAMMQSLRHYLRAALPGVRRGDATLADELALVRAYLMLIGMRLATRLSFSVEDDSGHGARAFPPMLVLTLVENAIRHGIEPSPQGGRVDVAARVAGGWLCIAVRDNGVGLGDAPQTGGTGVGLANIRNQLRARFGADARLSLATPEQGGGVEALIEIPLSAMPS